MASRICRLKRKPNYSSEMQVDNTRLTPVARILAMTLYNKLHKEIRHKLSKDEGFDIL
jgi:hypothetical protein